MCVFACLTAVAFGSQPPTVAANIDAARASASTTELMRFPGKQNGMFTYCWFSCVLVLGKFAFAADGAADGVTLRRLAVGKWKVFWRPPGFPDLGGS